MGNREGMLSLDVGFPPIGYTYLRHPFWLLNRFMFSRAHQIGGLHLSAVTLARWFVRHSRNLR